MVFVMMQGSNVRGVFDSVWEAKVFFNNTTGVAIKDIKDVECPLSGDVLFKIDNYTQARLKKTTYY